MLSTLHGSLSTVAPASTIMKDSGRLLTPRIQTCTSAQATGSADLKSRFSSTETAIPEMLTTPIADFKQEPQLIQPSLSIKFTSLVDTTRVNNTMFEYKTGTGYNATESGVSPDHTVDETEAIKVKDTPTISIMAGAQDPTYTKAVYPTSFTTTMVLDANTEYNCIEFTSSKSNNENRSNTRNNMGIDICAKVEKLAIKIKAKREEREEVTEWLHYNIVVN